MSYFQKSLVGLTLLATLALVAILASKKLVLEARRNTLLLEMIANISNGLDRLDNGLNGIAIQAESARARLRLLAALHRENLMMCAHFRERRKKNDADKESAYGEATNAQKEY